MQTITFITTNQGKVTTLRNLLPEGYEVTNVKLELPEIQAKSASEVSALKAKAAYEMVKKPLIVQDSSFHINTLNGFPGVYIKYVLETLDLEGILRLLETASDRSYYFEGALTYIEGPDTIKTFVSRSKPGQVTTAIDSLNSERAWSKIWQIVVPYGETKTLAALNDAEIKTRIDDKSEFLLFVEWLQERLWNEKNENSIGNRGK